MLLNSYDMEIEHESGSIFSNTENPSEKINLHFQISTIQPVSADGKRKNSIQISSAGGTIWFVMFVSSLFVVLS